MKEQTSVVFKITSAVLTSQEIQTRTGLEPDVVWKIGEVRDAFGNAEKKHGFVLESKANMNATLDDHVKAMLKRLAPCAQAIGALTDCLIEFGCIVHRNVGPKLKFERDDLRWLGVMGARLDVDVMMISAAHQKGPAKMTGSDAPPEPKP